MQLVALASLVDRLEVPDGWGVRREVAQRKLSGLNRAAIIRRDLPYPTLPTNADGMRVDVQGRLISDFRHPELGMDVEVWWDQLPLDALFLDRADHDPSYIADVLEKRFRDATHSLALLKPWGPSPVPAANQVEFISMLKDLPKLNGWMLLGPRDGGSSKTTWVSAYLKDVITLRLAQRHEEWRKDYPESSFELEGESYQALGVYRIHVGEWLVASANYKSRDRNARGDDAVREPLSPNVIRDASNPMGAFPPILWLEELDKFTPNPDRCVWLNGMIDAVYGNNGFIISTTNNTMDELRVRLDGATLRRLNGETDDPKDYQIWDLHKFARRPKKH